MRAVGLVCGLMRLKFVYLSERKGVCGANALNFVILRVKNVLNSDILAFSKALNAKSVVNSVCGVAWQSVLLGRSGAWQGALNSAKCNTAWRGEFDNKTAKRDKIQRHGNKIQRNEFSVASVYGQNSARRHGKFGLASVAKWMVFAGKTKRGDTANSARGQ